MGNITKKEIKKLLKIIEDDLVDAIEADSGNSGGYPVNVDFEMVIAEGALPPPIELASEESLTFAQCFYICYIIRGVRVCKQFCF